MLVNYLRKQKPPPDDEGKDDGVADGEGEDEGEGKDEGLADGEGKDDLMSTIQTNKCSCRQKEGCLDFYPFIRFTSDHRQELFQEWSGEGPFKLQS